MLTLQRNVRSWTTLRTWDWFKLMSKVKPMLKTVKQEEEIKKLNVQIKELEDHLVKEEGRESHPNRVPATRPRGKTPL